MKVYAYENKYFNIDIPENYKLTENTEYMYKWDNNHKYVAITINSNLKTQFIIKDFSEEDLIKRKEYIEEGLNKGLEKYNIKATVSNMKKYITEDNSYLEYDIYYPTKEHTGYDTYQKSRMYATKNYIMTLTYSSDKNLDEDTEYKTLLDSFKIIDTELVIKDSYKKLIYIIVIVGTVLGLIGGIMSFKKRK